MGSSVFFMDRLREIQSLYVFFENKTGIPMREIALDVFSRFLVESAEGRSTYGVLYVTPGTHGSLDDPPFCGGVLWCGFGV